MNFRRVARNCSEIETGVGDGRNPPPLLLQTIYMKRKAQKVGRNLRNFNWHEGETDLIKNQSAALRVFCPRRRRLRVGEITEKNRRRINRRHRAASNFHNNPAFNYRDICVSRITPFNLCLAVIRILTIAHELQPDNCRAARHLSGNPSSQMSRIYFPRFT